MNKVLAFTIFFPLLSWAVPDNRVSVATAIYKPFMILENDGRLNGIYHEYLSELVKKAGLEASFETMPIPRVLNHATKGTFDFFMFASGIPEARKNYIEVAHFHKIKMVMISTDKNVDLKGKSITIGRPAGNFCPIFTKEEEKNIKYIEYESTDQAIKMLIANRMNAICTTRELFHYELQLSSYSSLKYYEIPNYHHELMISLFVHRRLPVQKINSITKAVAELEQKKVLNNIYKKYGLKEGATH